MTTIEPTSAPWEDNGNGLIYGQCSGDDDEAPFVADVCNDPNAYTEQEQANARLIAAAPELRRAVKLLLEAVELGYGTDSYAYEAGIAALDKAA